MAEKKHSLWVKLTDDELRRLRHVAADKGVVAGTLAYHFIMDAVETAEVATRPVFAAEDEYLSTQNNAQSNN